MANEQRDHFFKFLADMYLRVTFDDVELASHYTEVLPHQADLRTLFSRNVPLNTPLVSAAMDTVTEYQMAIAMARAGGLGIIHRNLSPEQQAKQVAKVKLHFNKYHEKPITFFEDQTMDAIINYRTKHEFDFHTFPILDRDRKLVGLLTKRNFLLCDDTSQIAKENMTINIKTAPQGTTFEDAYLIMKREGVSVVPVVSDDQTFLGMYLLSDIRRLKEANPLYNADRNGQLRVGAAIGAGEKELERAERLIKKNVDVIVIESSHGCTKSMIDSLRELKILMREIRTSYPSIDIVIGNITESEETERLAKENPDGIKVGRGVGSICLTTIVTAMGCPQESAVHQCATVASKYGIPICADGGIRYSGDGTKALAAGASSIMVGNLVAGTNETPGILIDQKGQKYKLYRGMGSLSAMREREASRERYGQIDPKKLVPEGVEALVPIKGPVSEIVEQFAGGIKNSFGLTGVRTIPELWEKAIFFRVTNAGLREAHPHNLEVMQSSPNYSIPK